MWCCGHTPVSLPDADVTVEDAAKPEREPAKEEPKPPELQVQVAIAGAHGLRRAEWMPPTNGLQCCCTLVVEGREVHRTASTKNVVEPVWKEETALFVCSSILEFTVWEQDSEGHDSMLGRVVLDSAELDAVGFNGDLQLTGVAEGQQGMLKVKIKRGGQEYARLPEPEITIVIHRYPGYSKEPLGIDLDIQDGTTAWVMAVKPGCVRSYNKFAPAGRQVQAGDFIMAVNGAAGDASKLIEALHRDFRLELVIRRPVEFHVAVHRRQHDASLGAEFPEMPTGKCLVIQELAEGLLQDWNEAHQNQCVQVGDRIVEVSGHRGTAAELLRLLPVTPQLRMVMARPACSDSWWYFW